MPSPPGFSRRARAALGCAAYVFCRQIEREPAPNDYPSRAADNDPPGWDAVKEADPHRAGRRRDYNHKGFSKKHFRIVFDPQHEDPGAKRQLAQGRLLSLLRLRQKIFNAKEMAERLDIGHPLARLARTGSGRSFSSDRAST